MEEPPFLVSVQRIVGGIDIKDDLLRRRFIRFQEKRDEQALDRSRIMRRSCDSAWPSPGSAQDG